MNCEGVAESMRPMADASESLKYFSSDKLFATTPQFMILTLVLLKPYDSDYLYDIKIISAGKIIAELWLKDEHRYIAIVYKQQIRVFIPREKEKEQIFRNPNEIRRKHASEVILDTAFPQYFLQMNSLDPQFKNLTSVLWIELTRKTAELGS